MWIFLFTSFDLFLLLLIFSSPLKEFLKQQKKYKEQGKNSTKSDHCFTFMSRKSLHLDPVGSEYYLLSWIRIRNRTGNSIVKVLDPDQYEEYMDLQHCWMPREYSFRIRLQCCDLKTAFCWIRIRYHRYGSVSDLLEEWRIKNWTFF